MRLKNVEVKKIGVFRALQLGDMLCAIPAIRAIKLFYPDAEIILFGLPWSESFTKRFSAYFSGFIHFPGYPGLPEQEFDHSSFISFVDRVNKEDFDLILQMHGNGSVINPMIATLGAKKYAGFREQDRFCPDENLFMEYPENELEVERHLRLMDFLGIPTGESHLEFPVQDSEERSFRQLCNNLGIRSKEYVCVHPGARDTKRWWPCENFAFVADSLAEKGFSVVITGTESERGIAQKVMTSMKYPSIDCVGKTDLGSLSLLIRNAWMLLSNDTGVSHIASAVRTPSVIIFLSSDPHRWAPSNRSLHKIVLPHQAENINYVLQSTKELLAEQGIY